MFLIHVIYNIGVVVVILLLFNVYEWIFYRNRQGVLVLKKYCNWIHTSGSLRAWFRYKRYGFKEQFEYDCEKFFNRLEKGKVYTTSTHSLLLREIKKRDVEIIYERTKKKRMILEKLIIGNTENLFRKYQYYKVCFKIK